MKLLYLLNYKKEVTLLVFLQSYCDRMRLFYIELRSFNLLTFQAVVPIAVQIIFYKFNSCLCSVLLLEFTSCISQFSFVSN